MWRLWRSLAGMATAPVPETQVRRGIVQGPWQRETQTCMSFAFLRTTPENPSLTVQNTWNNIVITMKALQASIRQIGNSQGVVIPKPVLAQLGLNGETGVEMTIEGDALVLRKPASPVRTGWAEAARKIAEAGDDALAMGEFGNAADAELAW